MGTEVETDNFDRPTGKRHCQSPSITVNEINNNPQGVTLYDMESVHAEMMTGPQFGCINHEGK